MKKELYLVYITCRDLIEAEKIAGFLLSKRLVGCANIVPKIRSLYWWKEKIVHDNEALLLCKTSKEKIPKIKIQVKKLHSYEVPCIEFIKIADQNKEYFNWLKKELKSD